MLDLRVLLERLRARGLTAVLVEGGGVTVSRFLEANLVDRLHVAIAPLITGAGRPGLSLPARERIADCLRPAYRVFRMGEDVLFDCALQDARAAHDEPADDLVRVL
jgi:riboflavin biosynthesis pyrimidine reductase